MKKCLIYLLVLIVVVSAFTVSAAATSASAGTVTVSVTTTTPDITILEKGGSQTLTLTYHVTNNSGKQLTSLTIAVTGLEDGKIEFASDKNLAKNGTGTYANGTKKYSLAIATIDDTEWDAFSLTLTVKDAAAKNEGNYTFGIDVDQCVVTLGTYEEGTVAAGDSAKVTVKHGDNAHTWGEPVEEPKATCTTQGTNTYTCNVCQATKTEQTKALGHNWEEEGAKTFTWQSGFFDSGSVDGKSIPTATYKVICQREECDFHTTGSEQTAKVEEKNRKDPTCEGTGSVDYEATVTLDGKTYTDTTSHKGVTIKATGHNYGDVQVEWTQSEVGTKPTKAVATVKCPNKNCEYPTDTNEVEEGSILEEGKEPTCEQPGNKTYKATFTFTHATDKNGEQTKVDETVPAKGHKWKDVTVTWTGDAASGRTIQDVKAQCENGTSCDYNDQGGYTLVWSYSPTKDTATCTATGQIVTTATATIPNSKSGKEDGRTYNETDTFATPKLGHDFGDNVPVAEWPETINADGNTDPKVTKVTLVCNRTCCAGKPVEGTDITVNKVQSPDTKWKDATYDAEGVRTYTVTAKFTKGDDTDGEQKTTAEKEYKLPKLDPPTTDATVTEGGDGKVADQNAATSVVDKAVDDAVKAAIANGSAAGMDSELATEIKKAAGTSDEMNVTTVLEVSAGQSSAPQDEPNKADAVEPDMGTASKYYGIDIKVTVTGGASVNKEGYVHQVGTPIKFTLPKDGANGPIIFVARYHDNAWEKLPTTTNSDNLEFSSDKFSAFAVVSSGNLTYADVDPLPSVTYNGSAFTPKPKVTINGESGVVELTEGVDYDLEYKDNTNVGTATVVIKAHAGNDLNLTGTKEVTFSIVQAPSKGGSGSGGSNAKDAPDTGDDTPLALYAVLVVLSATALAAAVLVLRRKHSGK